MIKELDNTTAYRRWPNHLLSALFETLKVEKHLFYGHFEQSNPEKSTQKHCSDFSGLYPQAARGSPRDQ